MASTKISLGRQTNLDATSQKITSVLDPTNPQDAATKAYVDGRLGAADAMTFKGVIDASTNPNYPAASAGDTYKISVAGKIGGASGPNVQVGDLILCLVDATSSGTEASVGANWSIIQTNIDGAVTGPASSTASNFPTFSGTSGKVIQDSGLSLDTNTGLTADSDTKIPSQKAVKAYVDAQVGGGTPTFHTRETPTGAVNGSNTSYTLATTPTAGSEEVYLNGLLQEPGAGNDYTISGGTITYLAAPISGDKIRVNYRS